MASDGASRSSSAADSYIGSLISLTSKSEIRYEGVLYNINTEESSIGLRNVRTFGTEGRKKDGQQIPPSDKVFEYILFRGSDIKDLQVKSSPPVQSTSINNDPAIIQSHYPPPVSTINSLPSAVSGSSPDVSSQYLGSGLPLHQPGGTLGSWGASPSLQNINGAGVAMPMYWPGYYGHPNGLPHLPQQSLLRPPPGLPMPPLHHQMPPPHQQPVPPPHQQPILPPHQQPLPPPHQQPLPPPYQQTVPPPLQQPVQYPNFNLSLPQPAGASKLPELPSSFLSANTSSSLTFSSTSSLPAALPSALSAPQSSEMLPLVNTTTIFSFPPASLNTNFAPLSSLAVSSTEGIAAVPPINDVPVPVPGPAQPYQTASSSTSSIGLSLNSQHLQTSTPSLVTPGQLLQSGATDVSSSRNVQTAHQIVEAIQVSSSELSAPVLADAKAPILPLPITSRNVQKPNNASFQARHVYRGREQGRGTGSSRNITEFTEDFDFTAMNEKFKKDEVWGHLGKGNKSIPNHEYRDGRLSEEDHSIDDEDDGRLPKVKVKPLYNKDDFFDSLSCNALENGPHNGRVRYTDQIKMDTETFGDFPRYQGGRGFVRGGRSRGQYGRGYGYGRRGRGWYYQTGQ